MMIKPGFIATSALINCARSVSNAGAPCTSSFAFVGSTNNIIINRAPSQTALHALIPPELHEVTAATNNALSSTPSTFLPTLLTSVKVFDGSEITNTVVVSNSYWEAIVSKLPYLIVSQLLAAVVFLAIATVIASQGKFVLDQVQLDSNSKLKDGDAATISSSTLQSTLNNDTAGEGRKPKQRNNSSSTQPPTIDIQKLLLCIIIDILGSANEAIPLLGELVDVVYAPIAALLLRQLFAGSNIVFLLEFTEEILPFTDILPLATICWVVEAFFGGGGLARLLRIGEFAPDSSSTSSSTRIGEKLDTNSNSEDGGVIDVGSTVEKNEVTRGDNTKLLFPLVEEKDDI